MIVIRREMPDVENEGTTTYFNPIEWPEDTSAFSELGNHGEYQPVNMAPHETIRYHMPALI